MDIVLKAVIVLASMGAIFGLILAVASRIFAVKTDPRLEQLVNALPGANCGGCGYSGCAAYAQAVLDGKAKLGLCAAGGDEAAARMAEVMGVQAVETRRMVAMVRCRHQNILKKGEYHGLEDCIAASKVTGAGPNQCEYGCLGYGNCVSACKFDAIHIVDGTARVDAEKCTGCLSCAAACPKKLIIPVPYEADIIVACANRDKGVDTRKVCDIGCISCHICEKNCPQDAIHVIDNVAVIDHNKCNSCGICAEKCPRKLISDSNLKREHDLVPPQQR